MQKADLKVQLDEKNSILKEKEKLLQETLDTLENVTHQGRMKEEQLKRAESTNQTVEQLKVMFTSGSSNLQNLLKQRENEVSQLTEDVIQKNTKLQQLLNQLNQVQRNVNDLCWYN